MKRITGGANLVGSSEGRNFGNGAQIGLLDDKHIEVFILGGSLKFPVAHTTGSVLTQAGVESMLASMDPPVQRTGFRWDKKEDSSYLVLQSREPGKEIVAVFRGFKRADELLAALNAPALRAADVEAVRNSDCPLSPIVGLLGDLPKGLQLMPGEVVVSRGGPLMHPSQSLVITTHRIVFAEGVVRSNTKTAFLTDIRDVQTHKSGFGVTTLVIDTASGRIEGVKALDAGRLRDDLFAMMAWARNRQHQPAAMAPAAAAGDKFDQLQKLADLKDAGVLSTEEFAAEKAKILAT